MKRWGFVLGLGTALLAATPASAVEPDAPDELVSRSDAISFALQDKLTNRSKDIGADKAEQLALSAYYGNRGAALLWVTQDGALTPRLTLLRKVFSQAEEWGLSAADYSLAEAEEMKRSGAYPAEQIATAE